MIIGIDNVLSIIQNFNILFIAYLFEDIVIILNNINLLLKILVTYRNKKLL